MIGAVLQPPARLSSNCFDRSAALVPRTQRSTTGPDRPYRFIENRSRCLRIPLALLGTLGIPPGRVDRHRIFYRSKTGTFSVSLPIDGKPATFANGGTIGFAADSAEAADAFHAAGIAHGGKTCEEPPGIREGSGVKLYIAYLRDPDGNKLCALHRIPSA